MKLKTIHEAKDLKGKRVLLRVDFNTPIKDGKVSNNTRIQVSLSTIEFLTKAGAKVIILSHLGRPKGEVAEELRLNPVAAELEKLLKKKVKKLDDCIGEKVEAEIGKMKEGEVVMLENTRFHAEEKENESGFVEQLAKLGDLFVNDAFGVAHRAHASNFGIAEKLPAYAGLSLEREIGELSKVLENPEKPLVLVLGGAKIDSKIGVLKKFCKLADTILLGGGIANTFLAAEGFEVGESLYEEDRIELAQDILMEAEQNNCKFVLPNDVVCIDGADEISDKSKTVTIRADTIPYNMKALDIGERSAKQFAQIIQQAKMVLWNVPVGLFEFTPFSKGTKAIAEACSTTSASTILGGGDTIAAIDKFKMPTEKFTHVSTGGGAMLEFLENKKMPAIELLQQN